MESEESKIQPQIENDGADEMERRDSQRIDHGKEDGDLYDSDDFEKDDDPQKADNGSISQFKDFEEEKSRGLNLPIFNNSTRSKDTFKGISTNANTPTRHKNKLKEKLNNYKRYETEEENSNLKNSIKAVNRIRSTNNSSKRINDFLNLRQNEESKMFNDFGTPGLESKNDQISHHRDSIDRDRLPQELIRQDRIDQNSCEKISLRKPSLIGEEETYQPESKLFDYESLKQSPNFCVKPYHNAIYRGEVLSQVLDGGLRKEVRHGFGVMLYHNGRVYEGQWINDKRNGKGYERYKNNNIYEGDFKDGKAHGGGIFKWEAGETYNGQWHKGLKQGQGVWRGNEGEYYIGEWKESRTHGKGIYVWSNGDKYEGEWKNGLKHGQGSDIFKNGDVYVGSYQFGKAHGEGQYTWKNGSVYTGQFSDGMKHGKGKWVKDRKANSNSFIGNYYLDKKQGHGEFRWASGNVYKGNYKNDLRNGFGEMTWTDGSFYKGNWVNGIQHGFGKMQFLDGTINEGIFDHNIFQGVNEEASEIEEESYDDTQNDEDHRDALDHALTPAKTRQKLDEEEEDESMPIPQRTLKPSPLKERERQKREFENTDEEIEDIVTKAKVIDLIDEEEKFQDQPKVRRLQKIGSRNINPRTYETRKEVADFGTQFSSKSREREVRGITIQADLDSSSGDENQSYFNSRGKLPSVVKKHKKKSRGLLNATVQERFKKRKKSRIAIDPTKKMKMINSSALKNFSPARNISIAKINKRKRSLKNHIFSNREKTISGSSTLAHHGMENRRSRIRKLSKSGVDNPNNSFDEREEKKQEVTYFPKLEHKPNLHPNFDMPLTMKNKKKRKKNKRGVNSDSINNFAHRSVMHDPDEGDSKFQLRQGQDQKRDLSLDKKKSPRDIRKLLATLKKRKAAREKKAWVPSGPIKHSDGYNPSLKMYY
ncbi:unnamed protein product [Moneuplotes crassus]|uniref:Uncharacterized protein n=1 Tax=Euplotes crassus TaxID=5936 RepID=A0AAD2D695_EUPCR|nr:unnamed protein product [Moneuplotes crassus]